MSRKFKIIGINIPEPDPDILDFCRDEIEFSEIELEDGDIPLKLSTTRGSGTPFYIYVLRKVNETGVSEHAY